MPFKSILLAIQSGDMWDAFRKCWLCELPRSGGNAGRFVG